MSLSRRTDPLRLLPASILTSPSPQSPSPYTRLLSWDWQWLPEANKGIFSDESSDGPSEIYSMVIWEISLWTLIGPILVGTL
ncbi:uncharacterized protein N7479_004463 [Penicillium vulpinum]|uniref:uncharacterized protein n=1 Tax=Penicillium vulpinum TaxID=29845 RepID=UPI0025495212|nr:uncharacterized protein N7479_004463 [Penicillium vulpinum]KAJ5964587.1 hypothetical protein N7479_004463 [Penicillium vulpinum]